MGEMKRLESALYSAGSKVNRLTVDSAAVMIAHKRAIKRGQISSRGFSIAGLRIGPPGREKRVYMKRSKPSLPTRESGSALPLNYRGSS